MQDQDNVTRILDAFRGADAPLLPVLQAVQAEFGFVSETAMREIADALNLSRAEVYGVVSFYHDFRMEPPVQPVVKLCHGEACQARGLRQLLSQMTRIEQEQLEPVYCLGLCSAGPAALSPNGGVHARLDAGSLRQLLEDPR